MKSNPQESIWLREMMVRKELGYLPQDPKEFAFVSAVLEATNEEAQGEVHQNNKDNKLKGLIAKNR